MATSAEAKQAIEEYLKRIGRESKIIFDEFETEKYTGGGYGAGTWTYRFTGNRLTLEYWFSSFSTRKEETDITYFNDGNQEKLESDLRACLSRVQQIVKKKKGLF
jgi:hypothetical protein